MHVTNGGWPNIVLGAFAVAIVPSPVLGQCSEYELLQKDALKKGLSLAIRPFSFKQPVRYDDEPLNDLQKYFTDYLRNQIRKLNRFPAVEVISEFDLPKTDLTLEGVFTTTDEGSRGGWMGPPGTDYATVAIAGVVKRTSTEEEVLRLSCASAAPVPLVAGGGKSLVRARAKLVAEQIARTITWTDKRPTSSSKNGSGVPRK